MNVAVFCSENFTKLRIAICYLSLTGHILPLFNFFFFFLRFVMSDKSSANRLLNLHMEALLLALVRMDLSVLLLLLIATLSLCEV